MGNEAYPDCREKYKTVDSPYDKTDSLNRCTILIDLYYLEVLNPYRERMIVHQNEISAIYVDKVSGRATFAGKRHDNFYAKMMQEHADSNPDGVHQADYRKAEQGYQNDRAYMLDRYCFNAGCNGYTVPYYDYVAAQERADEKAGISKKKKKKKKKPRSRKKCKAARAGGGLLGGLLGGALGKAAGLGKVGTLIAGGLGAVLGSELACKLSKKEQEVAADATIKVVEKEQVGATVEWKSPERKGVSGSSTVTALNTEPNGATCLNITDVAIIDGEETRISKRMCRGKGKSRYTVMA
jgi:surface antigen